MKAYLTRAMLLMLSVLLMLCAISCQKKPSVQEDTTKVQETETYPTAQGVEIVGFLKEDDFPKNSDFTEWLEDARESEQIDYAVLVVAEDRLYRCYLYSAVRGEDDAVRVGYRQKDGYLILQPDAPTEQEQGKGKDELFCFTVSSASAPQLEILVGGDSKGVRVTRVAG
jgi:hypothetical protein